MGLLRTAGRVAVATRVHGNVQRRQRDRWARQDAASAPTAPAPAPAPAPAAAPPAEDTLGLLVQLGRLRDSGVLTADEFEVQKARILGTSPSG